MTSSENTTVKSPIGDEPTRVVFYALPETAQLVEQELAALTDERPGETVTTSSAIRRLLHLGAKASQAIRAGKCCHDES